MLLYWMTGSIFALALATESVSSWMVIRGSRKRYPALWEDAGQPTLLGNGDLISAYPLVRYVQRRDYQSLDDPAAVAFADRLRSFYVYSYYAACVSAGLFLLVAFWPNRLSAGASS